MTLILSSLMGLWACHIPDDAELAPPHPTTTSEFEAYLTPTFHGGCAGLEERFWIDRGGTLTWISEHHGGSWERVTGTWSLEDPTLLSHTLLVDGIRTSYQTGAPHPLAERWSGTVHLTPLAAVPSVAFHEEARTWNHPCHDDTSQVAAGWAQDRHEHALTLTGDLQGIFEPG